MKFFALGFFPLTLLLLAAAPARAAFETKLVAADARWVVYADLDSLRSSVLGKELISLAEKSQVPTGTGSIGLDWQKLLGTIGSATAYGTNLSSNPKEIDGTLIVQGTPDLRKIAESLLIQGTLVHPEAVVEVTDLPFPTYALHPPDKSGDAGMELFVAFPPESAILVSKAKPQLLKARELLRGAAPSLANASNSALQKFLPGASNAYLFIASVVPGESLFTPDAPQARIFRMTNAGGIGLGENGANTFARVQLQASSTAMADKLMKILQGMTAMMSLAETNDKQLAAFLNSAAVNRTGDEVTLDLAYSSERLAQMLQNAHQAPKATATASTPRSARNNNGKTLAEWQAAVSGAAEDSTRPALAEKTVPGVTLKTGSVLTFGRRSNGAQNVRIDRAEFVPQSTAERPLVFRVDYMRTFNLDGSVMSQMQFPGADGEYTLRIFYAGDPEGKSSFDVSVRDPRPAPAEGAATVPAPRKE